MDELNAFKDRLRQERPTPWEGLPDIPLYMDQIISYMPRQLVSFGEGEHLTAAMVNNYIKDGLLPRADGKKYSRVHLAHLTAICALKQVLSVREIKTLLSARPQGQDAQAFYADFSRALDGALEEAAASLDGVDPNGLAQLALTLALRSYADKLACQRMLELLQPEEPGEKKKGKAKESSHIE